MRTILVLTFSLILGLTGLKAQGLEGSIGSNDSDVEYSTELISSVQKLAALDAQLGLRRFNDYSTTLDITLFGYYSDAYYTKKRELNQPVGGGDHGYASIKELSMYNEEAAEEIALRALIDRVLTRVTF